jgi:hypothetical protein
MSDMDIGIQQSRPAIRTVSLPRFVKLIIISNVLPETFSFYIGDLRLTVTRLLFLVLTPTLFYRLFKKISAGRYRFVPSDLAVVLAGIWMFVGPGVIDGFGAAVAHSGPVALEFCIGYWSMRLLLSEQGHAWSAVNLLCSTISVVALLGLLDSVTDKYLVREWSMAVTGYVQPLSGGGLEHRLFGLLRAMGPLEHPILFGLACGLGVLLAASLPVRTRYLKIIVCSAGAFLSFSSAPLQGVLIGGALLLYERVLSRFNKRWSILTICFAIFSAAVLLGVQDPLGVIIRHLIFDPSSGYDRLLQWTIAGGTLLQSSPWFGMGFVLPDTLTDQLISGTHSIDSLWLEAALLYGIPGSALIGLSLIGATLISTQGPRVNLTPIELRLGTVLSILIVVIVFTAFTVHLWGTDWILVALLVGIRAHLGELARIPRRPSGRNVTLGTRV